MVMRQFPFGVYPLPTVLDLFSGCGGLALGAKNAGFRTELAIDIDPVLSSSFHRNFPNARLLRVDIASLDATALRTLLPNGVDGVIGGPPCQAFSEIGRRAIDDPRRELVSAFFRIVSTVQPSFFLMENVRGLAFSSNIEILNKAIGGLIGNWTILGPVLLDAANFGAATKRKRIFIFGFNQDKIESIGLEKFLNGEYANTCVQDAIFDLNNAKSIGKDSDGFDLWQYTADVLPGTYAARLRSPNGVFSGNRRTVHKPETLERFSTIEPGKIDPVGKGQRLSWQGYCPTLRAGTGKDRGSHQAVRPIHPTEHRVITVREAARLQGFPDNFMFHPTTWHSFRMIGNSVSPIIAEALLNTIFTAIEKRPLQEKYS